MDTSYHGQPRSLVQLYALTVCFCSLVCLMVALGVGLYDLIQIASPQFTLPAGYEISSSNESFVRVWPDRQGLPEAELTRARQAALADALAAERRAAQQSGVFVAIILLIDIVVFAIHWRLGRNTKLLVPEG